MQAKEIKPLDNIDTGIKIPGSKSYSNRALVVAALAKGETTLENLLDCEDTQVMIEALKKMGIQVEKQKKAIVINPIEKLRYDGEIFVAGAGTTTRFLTALCVLGVGKIKLHGIERMHQRPIEDLVEALKPIIDGNIEAETVNAQGKKCPPVLIDSKALKGGKTSLKGNTSSQYLSALLMVSPRAESNVEIEILGELTSKPYVDITLDVMKQFGVEVDNQDYKKFVVKTGQNYQGRSYRVESDASSMSYFLAAAAITGGKIKIDGANSKSVQGDIHFIDVLEMMGCKIEKGEDFLEIQGPEKLKAIEVDLNNMPDTAQTLAVLAAVADGTTKITGIATLKVKETDRIKALETELGKVGIKAEAGTDSLIIHGGQPSGTTIATYNDHRMAMSFSVLGLKVSGIKIENPECVSKSFPNFFEKLEGLYK